MVSVRYLFNGIFYFNISGLNTKVFPVGPVQIFTCPAKMHKKVIVFIVFDPHNFVNSVLKE